jgi:DNA-binding IclR family transcriptional regulator
MNNVSDRILSALRLKPLTIEELAPMVYLSAEYTRVCVNLLFEEGQVRRAAKARMHRMGPKAVQWEVAA